MARLFALDQNFPQPIIQALDAFIPEAELVPVWEIDRLLAELDDWEVLLALHHHQRPWDGLITTDSGMVKLPREMATLRQTNLTLVVARDAGHDPIKATGLLFTHLAYICEKTTPDEPQVRDLAQVGPAVTRGRALNESPGISRTGLRTNCGTSSASHRKNWLDTPGAVTRGALAASSDAPGGPVASRDRAGFRQGWAEARRAPALELRKSREQASESDPVFTTVTGVRHNYGNLYHRILKPAMRAAGIEHGGFHRLRHSCGTQLRRRGASLEEIQLHLAMRISRSRAGCTFTWTSAMARTGATR